MPIRLGLGITLDRSQSLYGTGTAAGRLLGSEPAGFAIDFANDSALIRWPSSPASQYSGNIAGLISASVLSFSRASTATYFDANGVMQTASNDVLRRTYDPSTLTALGYLPEPQRTNLFTYSEQLDNAVWLPQASLTVSANAAVAPDGATTMDKIVYANGVGSYLTRTSNISFTSGTTQTFSGFSKAAGFSKHSFLVLAAVFGGTGGSRIVDFDLAAGTTTVTGTGITASLTPFGGGVYRWSVVVTPSATVSSQVQFIRSPASITGDGVNGIYAWGMQQEVGSYPTSYIPTTSATVTRAADVLTGALSKVPSLGGAYTLVATAQPNPDDALSTYQLASINDGSTNNRASFRSSTAGARQINWVVVSGGGAAQANMSTANNVASSRFKVAGTVALNDFELVANGASQATDTSGSVPISPTTLGIGVETSGFQYSAPVENVVLVPRRLGRGEMIARTL